MDKPFIDLPPEDVEQEIDDPVFKRIVTYVSRSKTKVDEQMNDWQDADAMYKDCFATADDDVELYNPTLLVDIVSRVIDDIKLCDYTLRIPQSKPVERQMVRDAIMQIEQESGLYSEIRDDDKGSLAWSLLGNCLLTWGKANDSMIKQGIPISFRTIKLSQAYFDTTNVSLRESNGQPLDNEFFYISECTYAESKEMYPFEKIRGNRAITGAEYDWGRLPLGDNRSTLQDVVNKDLDTELRITQIGYYYNLAKGIFQVRIGSKATIVEEYDDNDKSKPNYPFKLNGENYLPVSQLKAFPVIGERYAKGLYHRFAKIARNDARRRNMAHVYADKNINPDRFIKMNDDRYATFINDLDLHRQILAEGDDSYIQLRPDEEVAVGDLRGAPLTGEFERMKNDDAQLVQQGGVVLQDTNYAPSQSATNTLALEKNKNRLVNHIIRINAGEATFLRRVILQFMIDHIKSSNDAPLATNAKVKLEEIPQEAIGGVNEMMQAGMPEEQMQQELMKKTAESNKEVAIENVTMGDVADYIRKKTVYVQPDYSAFNEIDYKLRMLEMGMKWAGGTPMMIDMQKEALSNLGFDAYAQDLVQQPGMTGGNLKPNTPQSGAINAVAQNLQQAVGGAKVSPQ